ncbi:MAG: hypothetical protein L0Y55_01705, partial [Anaerolineales bacterium]|nr:hypothetical protein [Anaerolineales bacterium]
RAVMRTVATNKDLPGFGNLEGLNAALRKLVHRDILTVIASHPEQNEVKSKEGAKQSPTSNVEITSSRDPSTPLRSAQDALLAMTRRYAFRVELVRRWVERNS